MPVPSPIKLGITGADGKMGQMILQQALANNATVQLQCALIEEKSFYRGKTVGDLTAQPCSVPLTTLDETSVDALADLDVLIDFTRPEGTLRFLHLCVRHRIAMVVGTTGFDSAQHRALDEAANHIPMVVSTNMAPGVHLLFHLVRTAAKQLPEYDAEIYELHHHHKVDAPSGTALSLGEHILIGRGQIAPDSALNERRQTLIAHSDMGRTGQTGARQRGNIGFSSARGGDVVGEHRVMFFGEGERIELNHISTSRAHYAYGALLAARYIARKPPRLYPMHEVLFGHESPRED